MNFILKTEEGNVFFERRITLETCYYFTFYIFPFSIKLNEEHPTKNSPDLYGIVLLK